MIVHLVVKGDKENVDAFWNSVFEQLNSLWQKITDVSCEICLPHTVVLANPMLIISNRQKGVTEDLTLEKDLTF